MARLITLPNEIIEETTNAYGLEKEVVVRALFLYNYLPYQPISTDTGMTATDKDNTDDNVDDVPPIALDDEEVIDDETMERLEPRPLYFISVLSLTRDGSYSTVNNATSQMAGLSLGSSRLRIRRVSRPICDEVS